MPYRIALLLIGAAFAGASMFLACSSDPAGDGGECESNGDCNSGICQGGACAGRVCACTGETCAKDQCDEGWLCSARGSVPGLSCTRTCSATSGCPGGNRCSDGLCVPGKELTTAWVTKPGESKCRLAAPCGYEVRASGEGAGEVKIWQWTFGDAGALGDADIVYLYPTSGTYPVTVTPSLVDGRKGPTLEAIETVCAEDPEFECTPGGNDCCTGTCTVARRCR